MTVQTRTQSDTVHAFDRLYTAGNSEQGVFRNTSKEVSLLDTEALRKQNCINWLDLPVRVPECVR